MTCALWLIRPYGPFFHSGLLFCEMLSLDSNFIHREKEKQRECTVSFGLCEMMIMMMKYKHKTTTTYPCHSCWKWRAYTHANANIFGCVCVCLVGSVRFGSTRSYDFFLVIIFSIQPKKEKTIETAMAVASLFFDACVFIV